LFSVSGLQRACFDHDMPRNTPFRLALAILLIAAASLVAAYAIQLAGYAPCELCLKERIPYFAGVALAGAAMVLASGGLSAQAPWAFAGLALIFGAGAAFGAFHAGIEWGFWPGPRDCTGPLDHIRSIDDFVAQLKTVKIVRCDAVAIRIAGLSLAAWNAMISAALAGLAIKGMFLRQT
jgi:disulfide bond formation protein DsbB